MKRIATFLAAVFLAACSGPSGPAVELSRDPGLLVGAAWRLQQVTLPSGFSVPANAEVTAHFDTDGSVGGSAGPNGYGATYVAGQDGTIAISDAVSTMIGGPEAERGGQYLLAMVRSVEFAVAETELRLYSADGGYLLFRRDALRLLDGRGR